MTLAFAPPVACTFDGIVTCVEKGADTIRTPSAEGLRSAETLPAMGPNVPEADETCRACGTNEHTVYVCVTTDTVFVLGEQPGLKHAWSCESCGREWTTPAGEFMPCPDGLSWCTRHEQDSPTDGYHGSEYTFVDADRCGPKADAVETLTVNVARSDTAAGTGEALINVLPWDLACSASLIDAIAFTPAAARAFAAALIEAADAVESEA